MSPLVSIIIPAYNAEKSIDVCVNSIISQSFQDWELIIVDDGSKDNTFQKITDWSRKDNRIKAFTQLNKGAGNARNTGIEHATADWICFVDSDDILPSGSLENLSKYCKDDPDLIIGNVQKFKLNGTSLNGFTLNDNSAEFYYVEDLCNLSILQNHNGPCGKLYRCNILNAHNIRFDNDIKSGEDWLFNLKYLNHCSKFVVTRECCYSYIETKGSLTHQGLFDSKLDIMSANLILEATQALLKNHAINNPYINTRANYFIEKAIHSIVQSLDTNDFKIALLKKLPRKFFVRHKSYHSIKERIAYLPFVLGFNRLFLALQKVI